VRWNDYFGYVLALIALVLFSSLPGPAGFLETKAKVGVEPVGCKWSARAMVSAVRMGECSAIVEANIGTMTNLVCDELGCGGLNHNI
jgi:hypothetical protein